ncbi:hypothetical protein LOC54_09870 [Acetobacter sp. AN02]|uniref:hypothetical protein n=1 Tax=Acetobacter sp. AN02 TaxID=2894186 RepID=UPI0024343D53|nr:hypothetical protein [Acetobacter sp. AN02]MDG6095405.1 hypothetical protein [Acetobacter sp. AN02]
MSGQVAFAKLRSLASGNELAGDIRQANGGLSPAEGRYDDRSCAMNATVITARLMNKAPCDLLPPETVINPTGGITARIMKELDAGKLLTFQLAFASPQGHGAGDHFFCAFRLDANTIIVAMGWQGIYDFKQYFNENEGGRFARNIFKKAMSDIADGEIRGVLSLSAFLGTSREDEEVSPGIGIPARVYREISGTICSFKPILVYSLS